MNNTFLLALSTLIGTVVGAGIFALPYAVVQSGLVPALFFFFLLGGAVTLLHLFMGEIALRTKEKHRLIGYTNYYLGGWARNIAVFSTIVGVIGTLLAYIIIAGDFLQIVIAPLFALSELQASFLAWAVLSVFVVRGIQFIARVEFWMNIALFLSVALIFLFALPHITMPHEVQVFNADSFFLAFGVMLFAFGGWAAVPEIAELFRKKKERKRLDNVIVMATFAVGALYLFFMVAVIGVSGVQTTPDALSGLVSSLGEQVIFIGALFGLVAIAASFLVMGNYLKNSLRYDFHFPSGPSLALTLLTPLVLFFIGFRDFVGVLALVGILIGVIEGILICRLFQLARAKGEREPEYTVQVPQFVVYSVMALFVAAAIVEIVIQIQKYV